MHPPDRETTHLNVVETSIVILHTHLLGDIHCHLHLLHHQDEPYSFIHRGSDRCRGYGDRHVSPSSHYRDRHVSPSSHYQDRHVSPSPHHRDRHANLSPHYAAQHASGTSLRRNQNVRSTSPHRDRYDRPSSDHRDHRLHQASHHQAHPHLVIIMSVSLMRTFFIRETAGSRYYGPGIC